MSLVLEQVTKRVGHDVHIADVSLELSEDSLNVLIGPTLSGKTSLMRLMAGLDRPTAGRVQVDGIDVTGVSVRKRDVAMVYQQFINYPSFTVYDNIASPLRFERLGKKEIDRKVREAAEMMRIEPLLHRLPSELSGGQQQRTAIARALVKETKLLILDEPLVNLDYKLREELRSEMHQLFRGGGTIVVYATTEPLEALVLGGSTVVLDEGRVVQSGATLEVYHRPVSVRCAEIFSDPPINVIPGRVEGGNVRFGREMGFPVNGHLAALPPGRYQFGVRASHLSIGRRTDKDIQMPFTVELAEVSGSETFIHAHHDGVTCVVQEEGVHSFALGAPVDVFLNPSQLFAFDAAGALVAAPERDGGSRDQDRGS